MVLVTGARPKNEKAREALARAMAEIVEKAGGQIAAAVLLDIGQSRVSAVKNALAGVEIETLIKMRDVLQRPIDAILELGPLPAAAKVPVKTKTKDPSAIGTAKRSAPPSTPTPISSGRLKK